MKKRNVTEWAAIAEIIGTFAIIVSLLLVAFQVHRNTTELQAAHSNDLYDSLREIELTMLASPRLSTVYIKGWNDQRSEMSEEEIELFQMYFLQSMNIWDQARSRMLDGSMSKEEYSEWEETFVSYIRLGATREDIEYMRPWLDAGLIADMEAILERNQE
jgi:hypothetical protein